MSTLSTPSIAVSSGASGPPAPKAKGLQLGSNKQPHNAAASLADELEREASAEIGDAWGDAGDLMDVNADTDDWSQCYTLPIRVILATHTVILYSSGI